MSTHLELQYKKHLSLHEQWKWRVCAWLWTSPNDVISELRDCYLREGASSNYGALGKVDLQLCFCVERANGGHKHKRMPLNSDKMKPKKKWRIVRRICWQKYISTLISREKRFIGNVEYQNSPWLERFMDETMPGVVWCQLFINLSTARVKSQV